MIIKKFSEFGNEPYFDFSKPEVQKEVKETLGKVLPQLGKKHNLLIGGKEISPKEYFPTYNPANTEQTIGYFPKASKEDVDAAVSSAKKTFETVWGENFPVEKRAEILQKAADIASKRKMELSVWVTLEAGKSMIEAVAGVGEFIDFLRAYAEQAAAIENEDQGFISLPGNKFKLKHRPHGVGLVIGPFNFPIAITCGLCAANIVTGNTVIVKPSSDSPKVVWIVAEIFKEAGLPPGVLNVVSGSGSEIGDHLVSHPEIKLISFTGSVETGLHIRELANKPPKPGQWLKVIPALEMGGKNPIIVCEDANLEIALTAVVSSAFGYNGQKCSACSRVYVDKKISKEFTEKLVEKTKALKIGQGINTENFITPVINKGAMEKILSYIETGKKEGGKILCGGEIATEGALSKGFFIKPTIFTNLPKNSKLEREEIFGPVLAVWQFSSLDEALKRAADSYYGLTGAIITNSEENKQKAENLHIGDFYINRKCTGAMVGREPFGGVKFSGPYGTGPGGKDFLRRYYWTQSVSEKHI